MSAETQSAVIGDGAAQILAPSRSVVAALTECTDELRYAARC